MRILHKRSFALYIGHTSCVTNLEFRKHQNAFTINTISEGLLTAAFIVSQKVNNLRSHQFNYSPYF